MGIGKPHPLSRQSVDVRSRDLAAFGVVALDIAIAEIVGEDDHDVGLGVFGIEYG